MIIKKKSENLILFQGKLTF